MKQIYTLKALDTKWEAESLHLTQTEKAWFRAIITKLMDLEKENSSKEDAITLKHNTGKAEYIARLHAKPLEKERLFINITKNYNYSNDWGVMKQASNSYVFMKVAK